MFFALVIIVRCYNQPHMIDIHIYYGYLLVIKKIAVLMGELNLLISGISACGGKNIVL